MTVYGWALRLLVVGPLLALSIINCQKPQPILIGFSGPLTGRLSDLGLSGRNGVMLAMEEQNASGGINGRPVVLLVKDDQHDPDVARTSDLELIDAGVQAIIGHMTSSMTMAVMDTINRHKIVLLSPTTSTHELTGLDDYLIRVIEESTAESDHLAAYASDRLGCKTLSAIVDLSNPAYTRTYLDNFKRAFAEKGGRLSPTATFVTGQVLNYTRLARQVLEQGGDGVVIISAALDAAMLCQQIRKLDSALPLLIAGWAFTPDFIQHGGEAVEGAIFSHIFDPAGQTPRYLAFRQRYLDRFARQPDFAALLSYEGTQLLLSALSTADRTDLKAALLKNRTIEGLQGKFTLDRFGDVRRERFYITIKNHRYQTIGQ